MIVIVAVCALVVALLSVLVLGLLRSHGDILVALEELGRGEAPRSAPAGVNEAERADDVDLDLTGRSPTGQAVSVAVVGVPHATLLAFLSTSLGCHELWTTFTAPVDVPGRARLVVVTEDRSVQLTPQLQDLVHANVSVVQSTAAWTTYGVRAAPYFVLVDGPTGRVLGEGAAPTWSRLRGLMDNALADNDIGLRPVPFTRPRTIGPDGRDRSDRVDAELRAAGIGPGHPSLYPEPDHS